MNLISVLQWTFLLKTLTNVQVGAFGHRKCWLGNTDASKELRHAPLLTSTLFSTFEGEIENSNAEIPSSAWKHVESERSSITRLAFLRSLSLFPSALTLTASSSVASARGLVKFPCVGGLGNTYHFMRAGESLLESEDIISTNPLFLTNREAALSNVGINQVEETCQRLREYDVNPTIVRYSLAANAVDSANIVGKELKVGRDRLVPEFNLMDPRAIGQYDMLSLNSTEAAIWALDVDEAGVDGTGGRPPPNEDGTPHETLSNQVTRLTNLLSGKIFGLYALPSASENLAHTYTKL
uniref:Uncharacterized protein n=1 Tax=Odontella aurita TaxID=265563 RepID=A0A7S4I0E2_9STRA|mmetsp:Transcript_1810/g.4798  ORF Transcript_1810/g.4798 Transcript_1810/m.4798 type:complete len:296 (+) Transcript_1810:178-1065(+)